MIKRVLIIIVKICICLSLSVSAGNVSVSDGSAFITKSEMTYQLNNISNRMTQLENSLDSKIDKLVSSYLTRNGIWNGINQTIINTNLIDMTGKNQDNATITYSSTFPSTISAGSDVLFTSTVYDLCTKITKNGLCRITLRVLDWGITHASSTNNRAYTYYQVGNAGVSYNIFNVDLNYIGFLVNGEERERIRQFAWKEEAIDSTKVLALKTIPGTYNLYFFVDKNDRVAYKYQVGLTLESQGAATNLKGTAIASGITPSGIKMEIQECCVY